MGMPQLILIQAKCPACGSADVFYTCHTTCCFNHVCNNCRTTFELSTRVISDGGSIGLGPCERIDTTLPTAPCAACEKTDVYQIEGSEDLICTACHSLLALEYDKVVTGG